MQANHTQIFYQLSSVENKFCCRSKREVNNNVKVSPAARLQAGSLAYNMVGHITEVTPHSAEPVLRWQTVHGWYNSNTLVFVLDQAGANSAWPPICG